MKKAWEAWTNISLVIRILIGLIIGAVLGLVVPQATAIGILGDIFVGALKAIAPLLVFFLVISSLSNATGSHGGVIRTVIILYMFSTFLAAFIAVIASRLFPIQMVLVDAVARLIPGVLGCEESAQTESFSSGLLEYPQYTRPREFEGLSVPAPLLGGSHAQIAEWQLEQSLLITLRRRPEMAEAYLAGRKLSRAQKRVVERVRAQIAEEEKEKREQERRKRALFLCSLANTGRGRR